MSNQFTRVSLAVEMDGRVFFAVIPQDRIRILMHLAGGLSDDGKLYLVPAPADFKFVPVAEAVNGGA